MRLIVVTAVKNNPRGLQITAESINSQKINIRWVIIDGGVSRSDSGLILKSDSIELCYLHGPDSGPFDAWNKAVENIGSEPEWVYFMGAGDRFFSSDTVEKLSLEVRDSGLSDADVIYGDVYIGAKKIYKLTRLEPSLAKLQDLRPSIPHHQGMFTASRIFRDAKNRFRTDLKFSSDAELYIRNMGKFKWERVETPISIIPEGGMSRSFSNIISIYIENAIVSRENGIRIGVINIISVLLERFINFIKR